MDNIQEVNKKSFLSREVVNDSERLKKQTRRLQIIENIWKYLFAILPLLGFLIFSIVPISISFLAMFNDINIYNPTEGLKWNNFEAFRYVFTPKASDEFRSYDVHSWFMQSIRITFWVASTQFVTLFIALVISLLLAQKLKGSKLFQVLFFIPYICSSIAVGLMWSWIFSNESFGIVNTILGTSIRWTEDTRFMTWCIIIAIIWQAPGYGIVMYKAAMANINSSLYEAAELDGANWFSRVIHVTLPAIRPTTFYLMMAGVISGLMTFEIATLIVPATWVYPFGTENMGITFMRLIYHLLEPNVITDESQPFVSEAAVMSWSVFIVTATLSLIIMKLRDRSIRND